MKIVSVAEKYKKLDKETKFAGFELPVPLLISTTRDVPRTVPSVLHNSVPAGEYVHSDEEIDDEQELFFRK